jgi:putative DNA primase/helicase
MKFIKKDKSKTSSLESLARQYARRGWRVFPVHSVGSDGACSCRLGADCPRPGKHPYTTRGFKDASTDRKQIKAWWTKWLDANIGIATGRDSGIFVVDVDGDIGKASLSALKAQHGSVSKTLTVKTGKGRHYYYRCDGAHVRTSAGQLRSGIDIRGDGGYVVAAGSVHASGVTYRYVDGRGPDEVQVARAPKWLLDLVTAKAVTTDQANEVKIRPIPAAKIDRARTYAQAACRREVDRVTKAPVHQRNATLNRAAFKIGQLVPYDIVNKQAVTADLASAAHQNGLDDHEIMPTIQSGLRAGGQHPRRLPFLKSDDQSRTVEPPDQSSDELAGDLAALGETDTDNAQRFARRFGTKAMHTRGRGWLVYNGQRWLSDDRGQAIELAKEAARLIADEAQHLTVDSARAKRGKFAEQSLAKGSLDKMLDLAKSLLAVDDKHLDAAPWLLNVENGTIDLQTGRREKHDPRDLLTKIAPVRANQKAKCPLFKKFLRRITGSDAELALFIQKGVGYSLTGITTEQVLFFVYGQTGSNGKSTLVNLLRDMMGDYGLHTLTETLLVKQYDNNIPADLARLVGARMVTAIEANANRQLDEAKIKGMTGGDPITARFMRQDFFEYTPEFKLWLVANDRPRVRGTDSAFWRRVRAIPLTIQIPASERDRDLPTKLRSEWPGILAWAVRGCRKWQTDGLPEPDAVRSATAEWKTEMDHLKRFMAEQFIMSPGHKVSASEMFDRYRRWCGERGEHSLTVQDFKAKLQESHDLTHTRTKGRSWWRGIRFQG